MVKTSVVTRIGYSSINFPSVLVTVTVALPIPLATILPFSITTALILSDSAIPSSISLVPPRYISVSGIITVTTSSVSLVTSTSSIPLTLDKSKVSFSFLEVDITPTLSSEDTV